MTITDKGLAFVAGHEGFVSRAYLDPAGVLTIGYGFTNGSPVFRAMWGRKLRRSDRIARGQADRILAEIMEREVGPAIDRALPGLSVTQRDACASVVYNLGPRALGWNWAKALAAGDVRRAADLLRGTGTTAGGKRLAGLVRRRDEEADLLEHGRYGPGVAARQATARPDPAGPDPEVREAQEILTERGFDPGAIDGWMGARTRKAVLAYQHAHPHLTADGILGPATLAQLRRDAAAVRAVARGLAKSGGGLGLAAGAVSALAGLPWGGIAWALLGLTLCLVLAGLIWRWRDVLARRINTALARLMPVDGAA